MPTGPADITVEGWVIHQPQAARVMAWHEATCSVDVSDVWWARRGDDLLVWAEGWPKRLAIPALSAPAWEALDQGKGQWWCLEKGFPETPRAVFQLNLERRQDHLVEQRP